MKRLELVRIEDVSGCSGTGVVAEGVQFSNGKVAISWFPGVAGVSTTTVYDSVEDVLKLHGHGGRTEVVFVDPIDYLLFVDHHPSELAKCDALAE